MPRDSRLSPECRLVFLTAGPNANTIAEHASSGVNWDRVIVIAERERAVSAVWRALGVGQAAVPEAAAEHLRRGSMVSDFRMLHLEHRLQQTLRVLRESGVDIMLLKGAAVGATVYPSFAERPMVDVDLLIRPRDADAACQAMFVAGWRKTADRELTELLKGHHHLPPFIDPDQTGLKVELHTSMLPDDHPFALPDDEVWAEAGRASDAYSNVAVPAPAHLLYHACVHFAWSHAMQFGAWRTFRDITALLRGLTIDWDAFIAFAQRTRCASACYWTLRLARHMCETPVPESALRDLRAPLPEIVRRAVERNFVVQIAPGEGPLSPSATLSRQLWRAAIRPHWSGHGTAQPWTKSRNWDYRRTGAVPDSLARRIAVQAAGAKHWWRFVTGTLFQR